VRWIPKTAPLPLVKISHKEGPMEKKISYSSQFKTEVAIEAINGEKSISK